MLVWKVLPKPKPGNELLCEEILKEIYIHELDIHNHISMKYEQDSYLHEIIQNKHNRINKLENKYEDLCEELIFEYSGIQIITESFDSDHPSRLNQLYVVYKPNTFIHLNNEWLNYWGGKGHSIKCVNI